MATAFPTSTNGIVLDHDAVNRVVTITTPGSSILDEEALVEQIITGVLVSIRYTKITEHGESRVDAVRYGFLGGDAVTVIAGGHHPFHVTIH